MASIFRRSKKKGTAYTIQYLDHEGHRQTVKGFTDKGLTEQLAAKFETEARLRKTGLIDVKLEKAAEHAQTPLSELTPLFKSSISERSAQYILHTMSRLQTIIEGCGFEKLADLDPEKVSNFMKEYRVKEDLGPKTNNHYLQAIDAFGNWCVETKRVLVNPVAGMERMNIELDVRHPRRALTEQEFGQLLQSARQSGIRIQGFDGEQRSRIYTLSYMTGLRRTELASLTPLSFDLDAQQPTLTVQATASKHRRKDILPLHEELVALLRQWVKGLKPTDHLFPKLGTRKAWLMVQKDLERVGIPYQNSEGIADFHAAGRHTHITEVLRSGASLPEAQKLARHSDIRMTMKYAHIGMADQAAALGNISTTALHGRCISSVSPGQTVALPGKRRTVKERRNPCGSKGFGDNRRGLSTIVKVEDRGVEPLISWMPCAADFRELRCKTLDFLKCNACWRV